MNEKVEIIVNIDPVATARPRFAIGPSGSAHVFNSKKTTCFKKTLMQEIHYYIISNNLQKRLDEFFESPIKLSVEFNFTLPKYKQRKNTKEHIKHTVKPDLDNLVKGVKDVLTKLEVYKDDAQVVELITKKKYADISSICISLEKAF